MKGAQAYVEWLSAADAAVYLGFKFKVDIVRDGVVVHRAGEPNLGAFYTWKYRAKPRAHRLGGRLRFRRVDLDACVDVEPSESSAPATILGPRLVGARGRR